MAIKGLNSNKAKLSLNERGKPIRLGRLNKGTRTGWGRQARFEDLEYFRFTPYDSDQKTAERMTAIFHEVYGMEPQILRDVRIPVDIAGNFNIEDHAWLYAKKYGKDKIPVLLARSDGVNVKQLRNPDNPRNVDFKYDGEAPHEAWTVDDGSEHGALSWNGKQYPWQAQFKLDIILTQFNEALYREGVAGHGVITLQTTSRWDMENLKGEYEAIITELTDLFHNPLVQGHYDHVRNKIPLRSIPLEVYRSFDTYTTPPYATKNNPNPAPDSRYEKSSWLLHWRIAKEFAAAMHKAQQGKTANILAAIETMPLLTASNPVGQANNDLFGGSEPVHKLPTQAPIVELDYDEDDPEIIAEWDEDDDESEAYDWHKAAIDAKDLEAWALAAYQVETVKLMTPDAVSLKKWRKQFETEFNREMNERALNVLEAYCKSRADGVSRADAMKAAHEAYNRPLEVAQATLLDGDYQDTF